MVRYNYRYDKHPETGWQLMRLFGQDDNGETVSEIAFTPQIGSNLISFKVGGTDYLYDYAVRADKPFILGTPILYPMPNRVRNATFTFDGRQYTFTPNNGTNFLHGLVREQPWMVDAPNATANGISVTTRIAFEPGKPYYELFPIRNTLEVTYTLRPDAVRFDFTVYNEDTAQRLPFGLAIHPYFRILGPRESVRIQVPAPSWMEAENLLPTGRLIDIDKGPADIRQPTSLAQLNLDDVFWGLKPDAPQVIFYDDLGKKVTLTASEFFTHSVVYTPPPQPFFCIENQSCSTDAHNLYAKGLQDAAHLTILDPGQSLAAWIEFTVSDL